MQASDRLRSLVAEANRTPWTEWFASMSTLQITYDGEDVEARQAHTRLIALAPQLAALVALFPEER